jgi:hypothetical protein
MFTCFCIDPQSLKSTDFPQARRLATWIDLTVQIPRCQYLTVLAERTFTHRIHVDLRRQASALCTTRIELRAAISAGPSGSLR